MKIIFLVITFIFSLLSINVMSYSDESISKNAQAVHKLLGQTAEDFKKKYDMQPIGTNVTMPGGPIKLLGLDFQVYHPLSKEEARQILIGCAQEFLMRINSDGEIRPYLKKYPFEIEDIDIEIFITNEDRTEVYDPLLNTVGISDGNLTYCTVSKENPLRYQSEITESYEEALVAIQKN